MLQKPQAIKKPKFRRSYKMLLLFGLLPFVSYGGNYPISASNNFVDKIFPKLLVQNDREKNPLPNSTNPALTTKPKNSKDKKLAKPQLLLEADRMSDDKNNKIIRAEGNVIATYEKQLLKSDFLIYDKKNDQMTARGNVYFKDAAGKEYITDEMLITDNFKSGAIEALVGKMGPHASLTASNAKWQGNVRILKDAAYTNCFLCSVFGENVPSWRFRAATAIDDGDKNTISLYSTWLEVFNVPVLYLPYLSISSKNRQSGFLIPSTGYSNISGFILRPAAFVVFNDYADLLFNPYYTAKQGLIGSLNYRHNFSYSSLRLGAVALYDKISNSNAKNFWQGYVYGNFVTSINNYWEIRSQFNYANPYDFFQRYSFLTAPQSPGNDFISSIEATGYIAPHYVNYSVFYYQDARAGFPYDKIFVGPRVEFFGRGYRTKSGGRWRFDGDMRYYVEPRQGTQGLLNFDLGWQQPIYLYSGAVLHIDAGLRADYIFSHFYKDWQKIPGINPPGRDYNLTGLAGQQNGFWRLHPELLLTVSYPFIANSKNNSLLIEPTLGAYFSWRSFYFGNSSNRKLKSTILDTDSAILEINADNLFLRNRVIGKSYLEDWARIAYGMRIENNFKINGVNTGTGYSLFLGHGVNFLNQNTVGVPKALDFDQASTNIIIDTDLKFAPNIGLYNGFLLDDKDFQLNRHDLRLYLNSKAINLSFSYYYYRDLSQVIGSRLQQFSPAIGLNFGDNWSFNVAAVADISREVLRARQLSFTLSYRDECTLLAITLSNIYPEFGVVSTQGWKLSGNFQLISF